MYVTEFVSHLRFAGKGLSKNTAIAYSSDVRLFLDWLNGKTPDEASIIEYKGYLLDQCSANKRTINRKLAALRKYFGFLEEKYDMENPTKKIESMKTSQTIPKVLTKNDVMKILDSTSESTPRKLRDKAILYLLYSTGIRCAECCGIKMGDFAEDYSILEVSEESAKGNKMRTIPIVGETRSILMRYANNSRPKLSHGQCQYFFLGPTGKLTNSAVWKITKRHAKNADVDPTLVHPHQFRHSIATHLLENDLDLITIKEILGHASVSTTQIYLHTSKEHMRQKLELLHPLS